MEKKLQDLAWTSLPKEMRDKLIEWYQTFQYHTNFDNDPIAEAQMKLLEDLYGSHNLTSDTEPEEMLVIPRIDAIEEYKQATADLARTGDLKYRGKRELLKSLFGDKCLPDEKLTKSKQEMETEIKESTTQVELKPGDKVKIILCTHPEYRNKVGTIISIDSCGNPYVNVDGLGTLFHAPYALEPYTEPESGLSQGESTEEKGNNREEKGINSKIPYLSQESTSCDKSITNILSDEELDHIIFELIRIRDNRRENNRQLGEILSKLHENHTDK